MSAALTVVLALALLLTGCGPRLRPAEPDAAQLPAFTASVGEDSIRLFVERRGHLAALAHRIRVAGARRCGEDPVPLLGYYAASEPKVGPDPFYREILNLYRIGSDATLLAVVPNGPLARAGLRIGDQITHVGDLRVDGVGELGDALRTRPPDEPIELGILRAGEASRATAQPDPGCAVGELLSVSPAIATWPDDAGNVVVGMGVLTFAQSDDELALAIAHEFAHRILGGDRKRYFEQELEAELLGLVLADAAGFDVGVAPAFWSRLGIERPWQVSWRDADGGQPPHGRLPERILVARDYLACCSRRSR